MASSDIDCVVIGEGSRQELEATLTSLSEVRYFRGKVHSYLVGLPESREVAERFSEVSFVEDPASGRNRAKARNVGWDAGNSPLVQFIEVGDQLDPDWFQRATKEVLTGVGAICGRIEPANPDVNRWHCIAYLESRIDLEEGRLLDVEPLLRREVLEEMGGFNEALPQGGALEFNARLTAKGRQVIHFDYPMAKRHIDVPNWRAYWKLGVRSGYRLCAAAGAQYHRRNAGSAYRSPVARPPGAAHRRPTSDRSRRSRRMRGATGGL